MYILSWLALAALTSGFWTGLARLLNANGAICVVVFFVCGGAIFLVAPFVIMADESENEECAQIADDAKVALSR